MESFRLLKQVGAHAGDERFLGVGQHGAGQNEDGRCLEIAVFPTSVEKIAPGRPVPEADIVPTLLAEDHRIAAEMEEDESSTGAPSISVG